MNEPVIGREYYYHARPRMQSHIQVWQNQGTAGEIVVEIDDTAIVAVRSLNPAFLFLVPVFTVGMVNILSAT